MSFFKRAVTRIKRKAGKTAILLILVFILGSVVVGAIAVHEAITNTDANLRRNILPILSAEFDERALMLERESPHVDEWEVLTPECVSAIGQLPQVVF